MNVRRKGGEDLFPAVQMSEAFEVRCPIDGRVLFYGVAGDWRLRDPVSGELFGITNAEMELNYAPG